MEVSGVQMSVPNPTTSRARYQYSTCDSRQCEARYQYSTCDSRQCEYPQDAVEIVVTSMEPRCSGTHSWVVCLLYMLGMPVPAGGTVTAKVKSHIGVRCQGLCWHQNMHADLQLIPPRTVTSSHVIGGRRHEPNQTMRTGCNCYNHLLQPF